MWLQRAVIAPAWLANQHGCTHLLVLPAGAAQLHLLVNPVAPRLAVAQQRGRGVWLQLHVPSAAACLQRPGLCCYLVAPHAHLQLHELTQLAAGGLGLLRLALKHSLRGEQQQHVCQDSSSM